MTNSKESKKFTFNPDRSSHFDLCLYCLNCSKCVSEHWKVCRARLNKKITRRIELESQYYNYSSSKPVSQL